MLLKRRKKRIFITEHKPCSEHEFQCAIGSCIHLSWVCDGHPDCVNKADESHCSKLTSGKKEKIKTREKMMVSGFFFFSTRTRV